MSKGINQDYLDRNTRPGEDFYQFVNGGWMKSTEIPPDRSSWGSFHELAKNTDLKTLQILEDELNTPGPSSNKAARLFETGMDLSRLEEVKCKPISNHITQIHSLQRHEDIASLLGQFIKQGMASFVHFSVHPDLGNSHIYSAYLEPAHLGLPERDYYLDEGEKAAIIRKQYVEYIINILHHEVEIPIDKTQEAAEDILMLETELARHMMPKEERRQIEKLYNPHSFSEVKALTPHWNWESFFEAMEVAPPERIIITEPDYFKFVDEYLKTISKDTLKQYLTFMVIHSVAPYAHASLDELHFDLYSRKLEGIETMRPRSERLVKVINQSLGELLGKLFVSKHFPPAAKDKALEMVRDIIEAFKKRITDLQWMTPATRNYAIEKLEAIKIKVGYPDVWKDFSALHIKSGEEGGSYLQNILSAVEWKFKIDINRIGQEVDRDEWFMPPQMVNAYYNPIFNEIVFPAAILQPPFFDWEADAAVNYGGMGAVIGHEMTHGFDDQGSRFDKDGNLNEWWTTEDREKFVLLTKQLIEQFDAYYPFEDLSLNGTFTLGENIADLGGLSVAYDALQLYYDRHGMPEPIDGFTWQQRFFMSWATVWRTKTRPEALRNQIMTDPHPPGYYRAIAAPSNMDHFYHAFQIQPGSHWYRKREDRIKIW